MATDFTQESVLRFLLRNGGRVRNADLLTHYKVFLREHEERVQNRELFKRYVNAVATVKQEHGVSYVVLKRKYRAHLGDVSTRARGRTEEKPEAAARAEVGACGARADHTEFPSVETPHPELQNTQQVLPAAGILNGNTNQFGFNLDQTSSDQPWEQRVSPVPNKDRGGKTCILDMSSFTVDSKSSSGSEQSFDPPPSEPIVIEEKTNPQHNGVPGAKPGQLREANISSRESFHPVPEYPHYEVRVIPPSTDNAHKHTLPGSFQSIDENPACVWPFPISLRQSQISASSPCLIDIPTDASHRDAYQWDSLSQSNDNLLRPNSYSQATEIYIHEPDEYGAKAAFPVRPASQRNSLSLETPNLSSHLEPKCLQGLFSSQGNLFLHPSVHTEWPLAFPQDSWSSDDALNRGGYVLSDQRSQTPDRIHRSPEVRLLSQHRLQEFQATPWHHSTGHLDEEPRPSLPNSAPNERSCYRPVARRLSHRLQSRMCRSLGADLDQAFREDSETARLKRLHRITSFLNVSSSQTHSPLDSVSPASSVNSLGPDSSTCGNRNSQVPLEPQEHEWFLKAASGSWTEVYALFREDTSLLDKRDFVSGYTVLHWIAKHGDHRVLNTLCYGVQKAGLTLDVDARSACGYTPLHLAALHGHKSLMRLLVHKFKANVSLRDNSGKRPWYYLEKNIDRDLLELLGAPQKMAGCSKGFQWSENRPPVAPVNRSAATVKRHSSFAALFKHKPHLRVSANAESV